MTFSVKGLRTLSIQSQQNASSAQAFGCQNMLTLSSYWFFSLGSMLPFSSENDGERRLWIHSSGAHLQSPEALLGRCRAWDHDVCAFSVGHIRAALAAQEVEWNLVDVEPLCQWVRSHLTGGAVCRA